MATIEFTKQCGQCEGTGTITGGLGGDGPDEACPVCDNSGEIEESMTIVDDITIERDGLRLALEYIGEGKDGSYDPDDPNDTPLLRFDVYRLEEGEWVDVENASYCTQIPATCTQQQAQEAAEYLFNQVAMGGSSMKRLCEQLSWTSLDTVAGVAA